MTVPDNFYNKYFLGIPILQQALFYSFVGDTMKQENPTPDNAFETIAKNFTGDSGMDINLLKEAINMKYCKILTATKEQAAESVFTADALCAVENKPYEVCLLA